MNLYSKLVPAGRLIVVDQSGFDDVYFAAESAGALAVVVVSVVGLLEVGGFGLVPVPEPAILISAQVK
jgi:hypothetical protein